MRHPSRAALLALILFNASCRNAAVAPDLTRRSDTGQIETVPIAERNDYEADLLHRLAAPGAPKEVYALARQSAWGGPAELVEITLDGRQPVLKSWVEGESDRYFTRVLSSSEAAELRLLSRQCDRLPDLPFQANDGVDYTFFFGGTKAVRQIRMNNPPVEDDVPAVFPGGVAAPDPMYAKIILLIRRLADPDRLTFQFEPRMSVPGLQVVYAHPDSLVQTVWADGADVRVTIGRIGYGISEQWLRVTGGKVGDAVNRPAAFPHGEWPEEAAQKMGWIYHRDACNPWQARAAGRSVHGLGAALNSATLLFDEGHKPVKILDSAIHDQILSSDGRWLVGRLDGRLIRYDLTDRRLMPGADLATVHEYLPLRWIEPLKKVLLVYHEWVPVGKSYHCRFRLLDPATGKVEEPPRPLDRDVWLQSMRRPFQSSRQPDVVWVAFHDQPMYGRSGYTMVGRYDLKKLEFKAWTRVQTLRFDSDTMWVDEGAGWIYAIDGGQLFRVPLNREVYKDWLN
jgi:hypothetical protein